MVNISFTLTLNISSPTWLNADNYIKNIWCILAWELPMNMADWPIYGNFLWTEASSTTNKRTVFPMFLWLYWARESPRITPQDLPYSRGLQVTSGAVLQSNWWAVQLGKGRAAIPSLLKKQLFWKLFFTDNMLCLSFLNHFIGLLSVLTKKRPFLATTCSFFFFWRLCHFWDSFIVKQ